MRSFINVYFHIIYNLSICVIDVCYNIFTKNNSYSFRTSLSNISVGLLSTPLTLMTGLIPHYFYIYLYNVSEQYHPFSWDRSNNYHWLLALLIADFAFYYFHVASHKFNIMWGAHLVHHQPEEYNITLSFRNGFFEPPFLGLSNIPFAFLGVPPLMLFAASGFRDFYMFMLHTNAIRSLGPLELIFNTPSHHRVHHHKDILKYGGTKNFGGIFIFWDQLFGTFKKEEPGQHEYGIQDPSPILNPWKSHLFFYENLFKHFLHTKGFQKIHLLFTGSLPQAMKDYSYYAMMKKKMVLWDAMEIYILVFLAMLFVFIPSSLCRFDAWYNINLENSLFLFFVIWLVLSLGDQLEGKKRKFSQRAVHLFILLTLCLAVFNWPLFKYFQIRFIMGKLFYIPILIYLLMSLYKNAENDQGAIGSYAAPRTFYSVAMIIVIAFLLTGILGTSRLREKFNSTPLIGALTTLVSNKAISIPRSGRSYSKHGVFAFKCMIHLTSQRVCAAYSDPFNDKD